MCVCVVYMFYVSVCVATYVKLEVAVGCLSLSFSILVLEMGFLPVRGLAALSSMAGQ